MNLTQFFTNTDKQEITLNDQPKLKKDIFETVQEVKIRECYRGPIK